MKTMNHFHGKCQNTQCLILITSRPNFTHNSAMFKNAHLLGELENYEGGIQLKLHVYRIICIKNLH